MFNLWPLTGVVVGFEFESDPDAGDKYLFLYLFIIGISIMYKEGDEDALHNR